MGHSISIRGYKFPDNIVILGISTNLSKMYYTAISNIGYEIVNLGEYLNGKEMKDIRKFLIDLRNELESKPDFYKKFNTENGWGSYSGLLKNLNILIVASYEEPNGILEDFY